MALWSFAGLAAGGDAFNNFLNSLITSGSGWRVQNNLDIAPLLFWNQSAVEAIYDPTNPWHSISPEAAILDHPFKIANASGVGYEQPTGGGVVLTGTLITTDFWVLQAAAQHHSFTYQSLVQSQFSQ